MLEVGNGALTAAETRTHFAFWAAMKSPLLIGTNVSRLSPSIDVRGGYIEIELSRLT